MVYKYQWFQEQSMCLKFANTRLFFVLRQPGPRYHQFTISVINTVSISQQLRWRKNLKVLGRGCPSGMVIYQVWAGNQLSQKHQTKNGHTGDNFRGWSLLYIPCSSGCLPLIFLHLLSLFYVARHHHCLLPTDKQLTARLRCCMCGISSETIFSPEDK